MRSGETEVLKPDEQSSLSIAPFLQMELPPGPWFRKKRWNIQDQLGHSNASEIFTGSQPQFFENKHE